MSNYRFFSIPGNSQTEWDPEVHGLEISEDDLGSGDVAEVCWEPGVYTYSVGCAGNEYVFRMPERRTQQEPEQAVLKGIHKFLAEIDFE